MVGSEGGNMPLKNEHGFAMLEVLISLLVILVGVLGIAGMQLMAVNNTETARYQSVATMMASSMAAKIQANFAYWGGAPANISVTGSTVTGVPAFTGTCLNNVCNQTQMAYYDLQNWGTAMAGVANADGVVNTGMALPSAIGLSYPPNGGTNVTSSGTISCSTATIPAVCTLTMFWSEKNVALSNSTGTETGVLATGTAQTHSYQTVIAIQQ
jgi:type IV pilus assembly protein PilV